MKKLKVGVWVFENSNPQWGGGFSYYYQLVSALQNYTFKNADILFLCNEVNVTDSFDAYIIKWKPNKLLSAFVLFTNFFRTIPFIRGFSNLVYSLDKKHNLKLKTELCKQVDIIYYLTPKCVYPTFPFIYTLWDLGPVSTYSFPELSMKHYKSKKKNLDTILPIALMIFAESCTGKKDVIKFFNINEDRIKVVPIFPSEIVSDKILSLRPKLLSNEQEFIIYPAQYWPHKNHYNLLIALKEIVITYPNLKLFMTGFDHGNKQYISQVILDLGLTNSVESLGFVSTEELKWLYLNSHGLVMPTFLGPTNLPLLEAAELGCPVACSNIPGHLEQLGDYGYYFDPKNPHDIAQKTLNMITDKKNNIIKSYASVFNLTESLIAIDDAFHEIRSIRFCWGENDEVF